MNFLEVFQSMIIIWVPSFLFSSLIIGFVLYNHGKDEIDFKDRLQWPLLILSISLGILFTIAVIGIAVIIKIPNTESVMTEIILLVLSGLVIIGTVFSNKSSERTLSDWLLIGASCLGLMASIILMVSGAVNPSS